MTTRSAAYDETQVTPLLLPFDLREHAQPLASFADPRPLEIEIGCGKGKFLIARAEANPDVNFLGVDLAWKWMKYAVTRSEKRGLTNIRFIKYDARMLVKHGLPDASVSVFHIYFPDPWPKRRHRKRRLVNGAFLALLYDRLRPGGLVELATDYHDYYLQMREAIAQSGVAWRDERMTTDARPFSADAMTNYEIKYAAAGRRLHYIELRK